MGVDARQGVRLVSTIGFAVEFAWAAGESVIVPYLVGHFGVSLEVAALVFLVNPPASLAFQPYLGRAIDSYVPGRYGSRLPFIMALTVASTAGLAALLTLRWVAGLAGDGVATVVGFIAFGVMDIAHDSLLVPARAMVTDLARAKGEGSPLLGGGEEGPSHAVFSAFQSAGRLCALTLGALAPPSVDTVFDLLMGVSLGVVAVAAFAACRAPRPSPSHPSNDGSPEDPEEGTEGTVGTVGGRVATLLVAHSLGWVGYMAVCFYWTAWLGGEAIHQGVLGLAVQAFAGAVVSPTATGFLERHLGPSRCYAMTHLANATTLFLAPSTSNSTLALLLLIPQGIAYPMHQTAGQLLLQASFPASRVAFASSLANVTIPFSQIITALGASALSVAIPGSSLLLLFHLAGVGCLLAAAIILWSFRP